jgi:hypothetical protein
MTMLRLDLPILLDTPKGRARSLMFHVLVAL